MSSWTKKSFKMQYRSQVEIRRLLDTVETQRRAIEARVLLVWILKKSWDASKILKALASNLEETEWIRTKNQTNRKAQDVYQHLQVLTKRVRHRHLFGLESGLTGEGLSLQ